MAGTSSEHVASEFIVSEFETLGLETNVQRFPFLNWSFRAPPRARIIMPERQEISVAPMAYTLPTSAEGIEGRIRNLGKMYIIPGYIEWVKYSIEDEEGHEIGYLVANPNGSAVPIPNTLYTLPEICAVIGKEDAQQINAWLEEGKEVQAWLYTEGIFELGYSQNVIGVLGKALPQLVVCAHYDSVYDSSGAVDNSSGVQVIYDIASRLFSEGTSELMSIAFIAMGCEEPGFLGSRYYVRWLKERGLLKYVRFCINFDMVGKGDSFILRTEQAIGEHMIKILEQSQIREKYNIKVDSPKASSDNWPFHEQGIPSVQVVSLPFPLYHQPTDALDKVDMEVVKGASEIGLYLVRALTKLDENVGWIPGYEPDLDKRKFF